MGIGDSGEICRSGSMYCDLYPCCIKRKHGSNSTVYNYCVLPFLEDVRTLSIPLNVVLQVVTLRLSRKDRTAAGPEATSQLSSSMTDRDGCYSILHVH